MFIKINMEWNDDGKKLLHDEKKKTENMKSENQKGLTLSFAH